MKSSKSNRPCARTGHLAFESEDCCQVIMGGCAEYGPLADIWIRKTQTSKWKKVYSGEGYPGSTSTPKLTQLNQDFHRRDGRAASPMDRIHYSGCMLGGNLYLLGGLVYEDNNQLSILNDLWRFSLSTNTWTLVEEESAGSPFEL